MIRNLLTLFAIVFALNSFAQNDTVIVFVELTSKTEKETVQNVDATIEVGSKVLYKKIKS